MASEGDRLRQVETREQADMIMVTADPDGVVTAAEGTFAFDTVTNTLYVNHDGATGWQLYTESVYGQIYTMAGGGIVTNNVGIANKVQVTIFDTNGPSSGTTPDHAQDHIIIAKTGVYLVSYGFSAESANADDYETIVFTNNGTVEHHMSHAHLTLSAAARVASWAITSMISLTAADTVEVWLIRNSGPAVARTLTFEHAVLNVLYIG